MGKIDNWTKTTAGSERAVENLMAAIESIIVSVAGRVGVWMTPLPSALLVSRAAQRVFELEAPWPLVMAVVIEMVGLVTTNLWLQGREWNLNKNKSDPKASEWLAFGLMMAYFTTTALLLLAFELPVVVETGNPVGLTALLFPVLSAVGIITLNERILQKRRETTKALKKMGGGTKPAQPPAQPPAQTAPTTTRKTSGRLSQDEQREAILHLLSDQPGIGVAQMGSEIGVHRNTITARLKELREMQLIERNGSDKYKIKEV